MASMNPRVFAAVEAYRVAERRRMSADRAQEEFEMAVFAMAESGTAEDRAEYLRLISVIDAEYEAKREKAGLT